jgi:hypothetical protein
MLELPLNHQSFVAVGRELRGLVRPRSAPTAKPAERSKISRKAARQAKRHRMGTAAARRGG